MHHYELKEAQAILRHAEARDAFAAWLAAEGETIADCAAWLGGSLWRRRAATLCAAMRTGDRPSRHRRRIEALARLFTSQAMEDLGSREAERLAALDLDDPRLHECCRIAEQLERGLEALAAGTLQSRYERAA